MSRTVRGRGLIGGVGEGEPLVSTKAFTFAHGVDPASGAVMDVRSDIRGSNVKGRVLFYPFGKGSTTASSWFLETVRLGNHPAAIVTEAVDLSAVIGSVMARAVYGTDIPVVGEVKRDDFAEFAARKHVIVDGSSGEVRVKA